MAHFKFDSRLDRRPLETPIQVCYTSDYSLLSEWVIHWVVALQTCAYSYDASFNHSVGLLGRAI